MISIEDIEKMCERTIYPVKYEKITAKTYMKSLASFNSPMVLKEPVPQYFKDMFDNSMQISITTPAGENLSLWHCLLNCLSHRKYSAMTWDNKKKYVDIFIENIDLKMRTKCSNDAVTRHTTYRPETVNYRSDIVGPDILYSVARCLGITIMVVGEHMLNYHFGDLVYDYKNPVIVFTRNNRNIYSTVSISGNLVQSHGTLVSRKIAEFAPTVNLFLKAVYVDSNNTKMTDSDIEFLSTITGVSAEELEKEEKTKKLMKFKLADLKMMMDENILAGLTGRITKKRLIEYLV